MTSSAVPLIDYRASGRIFNLQRYSLNDGAGIRTLVFFKGCPLHCPWCSNPESRSRTTVFVRREARCLHCETCEQDVVECPSGAYQAMGVDYTLDELLREIMKDEVFYRASGGGVTLSGGEVLGQAAFATQLLKKLKSWGISTAIETTGHGQQAALLELARYCDHVLYDFKIMDAERAHAVTGIRLPRVLDNFAALHAQGTALIPRFPLIPGYTMEMENFEQALTFLAPYRLPELHLLPFHQYGASKYALVDLAYTMDETPPPEAAEIEPYTRRAEAAGYRVTVGG